MATRPPIREIKEQTPLKDQTIQLEGGELEEVTEEIRHPSVTEAVNDLFIPKEQKLSLYQQIANEIVSVAEDKTKNVSGLRALIINGLPKSATREEAQAYKEFFERLKRISETAFLVAQEVSNSRL